MSRLKLIRQHLGLTQKAMASVLQTVQGNITTYENGRSLPEKRARLLIAFAATRGVLLSYDHIYGNEPLPDSACTNDARDDPSSLDSSAHENCALKTCDPRQTPQTAQPSYLEPPRVHA